MLICISVPPSFTPPACPCSVLFIHTKFPLDKCSNLLNSKKDFYANPDVLSLSLSFALFEQENVIHMDEVMFMSSKLYDEFVYKELN